MSWQTRANRVLGRATGFQLTRARRGPTLPPATHAVGTARASMFFDQYPRFYETSEIQISPVQMNVRYEAIIAQHRDADPYVVDGRMLVGRPSLAATATMLEAYGYTIDRLADWRAIPRDNHTDRTVRVYAEGRRVTIRAVRTDRSI